MKIFRISFGSSDDHFKITEEDREWVVDNFKWLRDTFGYPKKPIRLPVFTAEFFPTTFSGREVEVENILKDLCKLFEVGRDKITFELVTDVRDLPNLPYEMGENPLTTEVELRKGNHHLFIANDLIKQPRWLVHRLVCEFSKIKLVESGTQFDAGGDDNDVFVYLTAIYHGMGLILANTMRDTGRHDDGYWESRWNWIAELPEPVMAFSLAVYAALVKNYDPAWKEYFKDDFLKMFEASLRYVKENVTDLYNEREAQASELFDQSQLNFLSGDNEAALAALQKVLFLSNDDYMKGGAYNNIGYYYSIKGDFQHAISNFQKAIALCPDYAYPVDNVGYSLIMLGELDSGFSYLQKALKMDGNDNGYTYRNLALYHHKKNDRKTAEEFFNKSFEQKSPVDLLEYHYAEFLLDGGEMDKAKDFFRKSVEKKEERGIARAKELGLI